MKTQNVWLTYWPTDWMIPSENECKYCSVWENHLNTNTIVVEKINRIQIWIWLLVFGFNYSNRIQMPNYAPCTHLSDAIASDPKTLSSTDPQLFHDQWPRLKVEIGLWCQGALILVLHLQHSPHFSHCHCCSVHSLFLYTFQFIIRISFGSRIKLDSVFPPPTWAWLSRPGPVSLR